MTREVFDQHLVRMSVLRGHPSSSDAHWEVLEAQDADALGRGVGLALRTRKWFPTPAELLDDCRAAQPTETYRPGAISEGPGAVVVEECSTCGDLGWVDCWCGDESDPSRHPGDVLEHCGRDARSHVAHGWVKQCSCWHVNTVLALKRTQQGQRAGERTKGAR